MEILAKMDNILEIKKHWVPLYAGKVACGLFGIAEEHADSYLSLDEKFLKNKHSTFLVRASGKSMEPEIKDEDILVVDRSLKAASGSIVAVFYNGSPLCKQFIKKDDRTYLASFNESYKKIEVTGTDELEIFGVVIGIARDFY
ncbi:MAG: S24 family peptidase [Bacteriovoracaceae bacterium]|jgi:DNA polymerase V|nr:S24 family peptidase [Bacteriovoracaceae bacterium]